MTGFGRVETNKSKYILLLSYRPVNAAAVLYPNYPWLWPEIYLLFFGLDLQCEPTILPQSANVPDVSAHLCSSLHSLLPMALEIPACHSRNLAPH